MFDFLKKKAEINTTQIVDEIESSVYEHIKPYGFKKYGRTLHRFVSEDISQVINFQSGMPAHGMGGLLCVNLGIRIIKEDADRIIEQHPTVNSLRECINIMFRYALENKKAVLHIYNSANRDIYEKSMMKLCEYVVTKYLETAFGKDPESEKARASAIIFFKCELFGLSFEWIEKGMKEDAIEEIYSLADLCRDFSDEIMKRSKEMNKADNN